MRTRGRSRSKETPELNVTAYMNLMVVLVPFLLVMAVFSRVSILELNFPAGGPAQQEQNKEAQDLEVIVYKNFISVGTRQGGEIKRFVSGKTGYDLEGVSKLLLQIKRRMPDKEDVTLLLRPDVNYNSLVMVMDTVREVRIGDAKGKVESYYLFPQISIGDAPRLRGVSQ